MEKMTWDEIRGLLWDHLIKRRGLRDIPNAKRLREQRVQVFYNFWQRVERLPGDRTLEQMLDHIQTMLQSELDKTDDEEYRRVLLDLQDFLNQLLPARPEEEERESRTITDAPPEKHEVLPIGRVAPAQADRATSQVFPFWAKREAGLSLGEIVTAKSPDGKVEILAVVQKLETYSLARNVGEHFLACDLGRPDATLPTEIPIILQGEAGILSRSDSRQAPPEGDWAVYRATPEEIRRALSADVEPEWAVPAGFLPVRVSTANGREKVEWVPVEMDMRWVVGYEAGHINVAGISGVAAKTSFGLFLITNLLMAAQRPEVLKEGGLAVVAFNVKEQDLMQLDRCTLWKDAPRLFQDDVDMWQKLEEYYEVSHKDNADFTKFFQLLDQHLQSVGMRLFAPGIGHAPASLRHADVETIRYGWEDLRKDRWAFYALFDPEDLDDRMIGAIEAFLATKGVSWQNALKHVQSTIRKSQSKSDWISLNGQSVHRATLSKLLTRLQAIESAMGNLLEKTQPTGNPLDIHQLRAGHLWVIDITQIGDRARRYLFYRLLNDLRSNLERKKSGSGDVPKVFPGRVLVMVDELNRFAPAGRGRHPVRDRIVHIASQGRSIGLTLLGLEQMASRIDDEVLTNTSNLFVGRAHPAEITGPAYAWLRPLREQVMALPAGTMVAWHPKWRQPLLLRFPRPLHVLHKAAEKRLKGRGES